MKCRSTTLEKSIVKKSIKRCEKMIWEFIFLAAFIFVIYNLEKTVESLDRIEKNTFHMEEDLEEIKKN